MTLEIYHTLFIIFLIMTIILCVLLILLFFIFDIRKIISIKTGWAIKQSVKELNQINQKGDNGQRKKYKGHSVQVYKNQGNDLFEQESNEMNNGDKISNLNDSTIRAAESTSMITIELEQKEEKMDSLNINTESGLVRTVSDLKNRSKENQIFNIFETKIVMFSDEIITKE